ncbi:MAG: hypothetical protein JWQ74_2709 [Marmoricola sp.]|nr:hypothetical protein [Marmoricola sp.]
MKRLLAVILALGLALALAGCRHIPKDATVKEFCGAGEKFNSLTKVSFDQGRKAIDALAGVGTPPDIDKDARAGFVELIKRMDSSENADDFRARTQKLTKLETEHRLDLYDYIQKTCTVPAG